MGVVVRTWNLYHGNADPPRRRGFLRAMVELASADGPAVLCLQEVPVWALRRLDDWTGMTAVSAVARPPLWPAPLSAWVTRSHQGLFRSAVSGQANAILVAPELEVEKLGHAVINLHGRERRVVQALRVGGVGVVANLHANNELRHPDVPAAEVERARAFVEAQARDGEPVVIAGDFNFRSPALPGYSPGGPGIDHVLVRGASAGPVVVWPLERRMQNGVVLSDHPPVEREVG